MGYEVLDKSTCIHPQGIGMVKVIMRLVTSVVMVCINRVELDVKHEVTSGVHIFFRGIHGRESWTSINGIYRLRLFSMMCKGGCTKEGTLIVENHEGGDKDDVGVEGNLRGGVVNTLGGMVDGEK